MGEQDWHGGEQPEAMFAHLAGRGEARRWRLFTCACLRELGHLLSCSRARSAFLVVQGAAEGEAGADELARAHADAVAAHKFMYSSSFARGDIDRRIRSRVRGVSQALLHATMPAVDPEPQAILVASTLRFADLRDPAWDVRVRRLCCDLMRDIFGDPFRAALLPAKWLRERGQVAAAIARTIYDENSFDELPILADALEDADCPAAEVIRHCREGGPHGRGCWAVDLLAGQG